MLKYLKKSDIWPALDAGLHTELGWNANIHLKTWQDVAVYRYVRDLEGKRIAEIGGGSSRILRKISAQNTCVNVDKLEGNHGGPKGDQNIPNVETLRAFLGEYNEALEDNSFDYVISVSVIEHVPNVATDDFLKDMLRILKPGGTAIHAIDLYVGDTPIPAHSNRLKIYADWLGQQGLEPLGLIEANEAVFSSGMMSNPDLTMWQWNSVAPNLQDLRLNAQSVSLLLGFKKS